MAEDKRHIIVRGDDGNILKNHILYRQSRDGIANEASTDTNGNVVFTTVIDNKKPNNGIDFDSYSDKRREGEEAEKVKGFSNPYSRANVDSLVSGKINPGVMFADATIDAVPTLALYLLGKRVKNSNSYKDAKIREIADYTDYKFTSPEAMSHIEGDVGEPYGQLGRIVYKLYGKDANKRASEIVDKEVGKMINNASKKYGISLEEAGMLVDNIVGDNYKKGSSLAGDDLMGSISALRNKIKEVKPLAQDKVDDALYMVYGKDGSIRYDTLPNDKLKLATPTVLNTLSAVNAINDVGDKLFKAENPRKQLEGLKSREKGLQPSSPFFTITELLDGLTDNNWRYDKQSLTKEVNKIYDQIMDSGTEEQKKIAIDAYSQINFKKKSSIKDALILMLQAQ